MSKYRDLTYANTAKQLFHSEGELEFDDIPVVSPSSDGGAYVQCWCWVSDDDVKAGRKK